MKKTKIPTIKIEPQAKKAKKKVKAKKAVPRTIGYPPIDQLPPDIPESPVKTVKLESGAKVNVQRVVQPPSPPPPAKRDVVMTGHIVQGYSCTWLGDLGEAGDDPLNPERPVCPFCGAGLVVAGDQELARMGNRLYELGTYDSVNPPPRPHPNFVDFVAWMKSQPKCWPSAEEAALDYRQATGKICDPSR